MREVVREGCLYPIILHIPLLRPLAGLFLSRTVRRSISQPPLHYTEGLKTRMKNKGISLEEAHKEAIEEQMRTKSYEHIPIYDSAYNKLKGNKKTPSPK